MARAGGWWRSVALAAAVLLAAVPAAAAPLRFTGTHPGELATVAAWALGLQYTNASQPASFGAVRIHSDPGWIANGTAYYHVIPYSASLALRGLLEAGVEGAPEAALRWIAWSASHAQANGTILDHWYLADGSGETTCPPDIGPGLCHHADADDSYAATLLGLAGALAGATGDAALLAPHKADLERIAGAVLALQQPDGLTWALANHRVKYLMDNSEVAWGLAAWAEVERALGDEPRAQESEAAAAAVRAGILGHLYSDPAEGGTGLYHVYRDEAGAVAEAQPARPFVLDDAWYPRSVAIAWPHLFGLTASDDPIAQRQMRALDAVWDGFPNPDWTRNAVDPTRFLWPSAGHAALLAGYEERAAEHAEFVKCRKLPSATDPGFRYPWTVDDAGWLAATLARGLPMPEGVMACPDTLGLLVCAPPVQGVPVRYCADDPAPAVWVRADL